jgi:hypothetical protein
LIPTRATDELLWTYVHNLVDTYSQATLDQRVRGQRWYRTAHDLASIIGDGNIEMGAGVLAALSANKRWPQNVQLAKDAAGGNIHGHTGVMLTKVGAIINGADPATVLPMNLKTGNFYRAILDPDDPDTVVIDRHMHDVAVGRWFGTEDRGLSNTTRYATLALAVRLAAREVGEITNDFQATVWIYQVEKDGK